MALIVSHDRDFLDAVAEEVLEPRPPRRPRIEVPATVPRVGRLLLVRNLDAGPIGLPPLVRGLSEDEARTLVGRVVFTDVGDMPLSRLSAGERRRVELAVFFATAPDLIVLDEPTNHLDLPTVEMLEEALDEYRGAVIACRTTGASSPAPVSPAP